MIQNQKLLHQFTQNMLARDSVALRNYIQEISPDIDLTSEIEIGGETVSVSIRDESSFCSNHLIS